jgi:hypothetical protein
MANSSFYYIGDDEAYYKTLVGEFKNLTRLQIDFERISETDEKKIQMLFIRIFREKPGCIFIDFSKNTDDYLHLVRLISRTKLEHQMIIVGLVDYLSPVEVVKEIIVTGAHLAHIKSPECYDIVFDVIKLLAPNEIGNHDFAKARVREVWQAGLPVKIGFISEESLHFETDFKLQKDQKIHLKHGWMKKRTVPSDQMIVRKISQSNIFYHFKYSIDAELSFIDDFVPAEGMDEPTILQKQQEQEENILYHKKLLSKWIYENGQSSAQKRAKILIIDREFHFFDNQKRTDKHPYTLRCVPYLDDVNLELDRLEPQIIVFNLEKAEADDPKNTMAKLTELLEIVKNKIQDTSPFLIVFNSQHDSKSLQDSLQYSQLMSSSQDFSVELLEKIADKLESKISQGPVSREDKKVFLKKTNSASIGEILIPISVLKVSETDMIFQTDIPLTEGLNFHMTEPVEMYINVIPLKSQSKIPEYHGLIHGLGEKEKAELRRYVNAVFFRDHDAQILAEAEEFKKLNEAKLLEKIESSKKDPE